MSRSEIPVRRRQRHQKGNLFEKCGAFYIRYYTRIGGVLKQKTKKLCAKDEKYHSKTCKAVRLLRDEFMLGINSNNMEMLEAPRCRSSGRARTCPLPRRICG
jgi:hypothetical protein